MKTEGEIKKKLKEYSPESVVFLKERWRKLVEQGKTNLIEKEKGVNPQVIYDILTLDKIKSAKPAKYETNRYVITIKHSPRYEIEIILKFDSPLEGDLGIITFIKKLIKPGR